MKDTGKHDKTYGKKLLIIDKDLLKKEIYPYGKKILIDNNC